MSLSRSVPRLVFAGLGWIGRHRLQAVAESGRAQIVGIVDPDRGAQTTAQILAPDAEIVPSFGDAVELQPDGIVIATPSAFHPPQSIQALERGIAVFCQKPLGRSGAEVREVVHAARHADRLLGVDLCYRFTRGLTKIRELMQSGELGKIYAVDLTFHNAYGPDKPWFYDFAQAGGGCLLDLGTHLVDFLYWAIPAEPVRISGALYAGGRRLIQNVGEIEDFAAGEIEMSNGVLARLACSWRASTGCDARIEIAVFGTCGGATFRNVNGSFYDFIAERHDGTRTAILATPPDAWGGRAIVSWASRLAEGQRYDPDIERQIQVAGTLDALYGRPADLTAHSAA